MKKKDFYSGINPRRVMSFKGEQLLIVKVSVLALLLPEIVMAHLS